MSSGNADFRFRRFHLLSVMAGRWKDVKAVLIDLSGTLHIENTAITGAVEALQRLRKSGLPIRFVTNTTKESQRVLHERLTYLGFKLQREEIFTSLSAARTLVESRKLRPMLLLEEAALEDFKGIPTENPNAVVVGLAPSLFNYQPLNQAFRLLLDGAPLIAIHKGRYYKRSDGLALGPGPFVHGLEYATDVKAEIVGKPAPAFFKAGLSGLGAEPHEAVMIGDDVRDDIGGAQATGMKGILVQTGKYRPGDEAKISPPPEKVCSSFPEAIEFLLQESSKSYAT